MRYLAPLLSLLLLTIPATGQVNKSTMQTNVSTTFPDNVTGLITPAATRTFLNGLVNSYQQYFGVRSNATTSDTIALADYGQLVMENNAAPVAVALPQAIGSFATFNVTLSNLGAGVVTVTPTTSTINGAATFTLNQGQSVGIVSDGTNWQVVKGIGSSLPTPYSTMNSGNSGGIPFFLNANALNSSGTLVTNGIVIGGGIGGAPSTITACTSGQLPIGQAGAPSCQTMGGDATINNSGSLTIGAAAVSNSKIANSPAVTFKGNPTNGSAAPTDFTINGLTQSVTPDTTNDYLVVWDHTANTFKKINPATIATSATAGVSSLNGLAGGLSIVQGGNISLTASGTSVSLFVEAMPPQGRITPTSGVCAPISDAAAATTIYYAPCGLGRWVPIYDGSLMASRQFTANDTDNVGLSIALGSNWAANTIYSVFVGLNGGNVTLCTGPAWTNSGAGTSTRGSGAGTSELQQYFRGLYTNKNTMTCRLSNTTTFSCAVNQCTYLGDFRTNGSTGTVDLKFGTAGAGGGTACICIWNAFNQVQAFARVSDTTASASPTNAWRAYLNDTGNSINFLTGLQLTPFDAKATGAFTVAGVVGASARVGTSLNNSAPTNADCQASYINTSTNSPTPTIETVCPYGPQIGYNTLFELEHGDGNASTSLGNLSFAQFLSANMWW